jgi:hypothetical protein
MKSDEFTLWKILSCRSMMCLSKAVGFWNFAVFKAMCDGIEKDPVAVVPLLAEFRPEACASRPLPMWQMGHLRYSWSWAWSAPSECADIFQDSGSMENTLGTSRVSQGLSLSPMFVLVVVSVVSAVVSAVELKRRQSRE